MVVSLCFVCLVCADTMEYNNQQTSNSATGLDTLERFITDWEELLNIEKSYREFLKENVEKYCIEKGVKYSEVRKNILKRFEWTEDIISAEPFEPNSRVVVMACCHYFMREPLEKWFLSKGKFECPVCKRCDEYIEE